MGTSKAIAGKLGAPRVHDAESPAHGVPVDRLRKPLDTPPKPCPITESESNESQESTRDARDRATSLDDYRIERLARLKRQAAKAEHELVELEQMRNEFLPLLLGVLQYTKSLYPDCTKNTHLIVNALVDKLAIEVSKDEPKDTRSKSVRSSKRRMPR